MRSFVAAASAAFLLSATSLTPAMAQVSPPSAPAGTIFEGIAPNGAQQYFLAPGGGGSSAIPGWPDKLVCTMTGLGTVTLYATADPSATGDSLSGLYVYAVPYFGYSTNELTFNADGSAHGGAGPASPDCSGKSIAALIAAGKAFPNSTASGSSGSGGSGSGTPGRGITSAAVVPNSGDLVLTYTDGTTQDVGHVVGTPGAPGTGTPGAAGRGIASSAVNSSGDLVLTYTDSTTQDVGHVVGSPGAPGTSAPPVITAQTEGAACTVAGQNTVDPAFETNGILWVCGPTSMTWKHVTFAVQ